MHAAFEYYHQGAKLGNPASLAKCGWFFENGYVVDKDIDEAIGLYQLAAKKNEPSAIEALKRLENNQNSEETP